MAMVRLVFLGVAMSSRRRIAGGLVASVGLLLICAAPASADTGGRPFTLDLTGANEVNGQGVPNQGDPDGSGTAELRINPGQGRVCWTIELPGWIRSWLRTST